MHTPIYKLESKNNDIYIKRDDLIPYSFGGNKARKGILFFEDIIDKKCNAVVTYGSASSNHVRIVSNKCCELDIPCYVVSPTETAKSTSNSKMYKIFNAKIIEVPVQEVSNTIDKTISLLKENGKKPYFIPGGGHGNIGTKAYVNSYKEILEFEKKENIIFDYIFHASGTGTTQAGLVCGSIINNDKKNIVGISIARKNPRGRDVIVESIKDYLSSIKMQYNYDSINDKVIFTDKYIQSGYGSYNTEILDTIKTSLIRYGIPMDTTYVGKAFFGMNEYIKENCINKKNILFIHTGGSPLFFDDLEVLSE